MPQVTFATPIVPHTIVSKVECQVVYDIGWVHEREAIWEKAPFGFKLVPTRKEVAVNQSAQVLFKLDVWSKREQEQSEDPFWGSMSRTAGNVEGQIGVRDIQEIGGVKKVRWIFVDWKRQALVTDSDTWPEGSTPRFSLSTTTPLKLAKRGQTSWVLLVRLAFSIPGTLQQQSSQLSDALHPFPSPWPASTFRNIGGSLSHPPRLALRLTSPTSDRVSYVYVKQDKIASASSYLHQLVEAKDGTKATRTLDGRSSLEPVLYDSDEEEDSQRYQEEVERARPGRDARSAEPGPPEKKRRVNNQSSVGTQAVPIESQQGEERTSRQSSENGGNAEQAEEHALAHSDHPCEHMKVIDVPECAESTLRAVYGWIRTSQITFAPLSINDKENRTAVINAEIEGDSDCLVPVSPRSVYRLAERFRLDKLAVFALRDVESKLSTKNGGVLALSVDCHRYPDFQKLVHKYVRAKYRHVHNSIEKPVHAYQDALLGRLLAPLLHKGALHTAMKDYNDSVSRCRYWDGNKTEDDTDDGVDDAISDYA